MRVAVYTDYKYRRDAEAVYAEKAFALFLGRLAHDLDGLVLLGRLEPRPGQSALPSSTTNHLRPLALVSDARPTSRSGACDGEVDSSRWRALDDVDVVWLLGRTCSRSPSWSSRPSDGSGWFSVPARTCRGTSQAGTPTVAGSGCRPHPGGRLAGACSLPRDHRRRTRPRAPISPRASGAGSVRLAGGGACRSTLPPTKGADTPVS